MKRGAVMNTSLILRPSISPKAKNWLSGRRGMLTLLGVAGIAAIGSGWYWLGFAAIAPVLYLLPCAVMMAMCAKGMSHGDGRAPGAGKGCGAEAKKPSDRS